MAEALKSLAGVVEDLRARTDTDHVLREICGQYALEKCTLVETDLHHASIRFMSWMRLLLFGVHRATLQKPDPDVACMLPTSTLISGLSFILTVDESQFMPEEPEVDWKAWKCYTFLLGLRLLRGSHEQSTYTASRQQLQLLKKHLFQNCPSGDDPRDASDVSWLCHQLLLSAQSSNDAYTGNANPGHTVHDQLSGSNADWADEYWHLFDGVSDAEATFFANVSQVEVNECHEYLSRTLLGPFSSQDYPQHDHWRLSLARTLVIPASFFPEPHQIRKDIDERYHLELGLHSTVRSHLHHRRFELAGTAKSLHIFLSSRELVLQDAGGSLHKEISKISGRASDWYHKTHEEDGSVTHDHDESDGIYVFSCPQLHLTSRKGLEDYLGNVDPSCQKSVEQGATHVLWASNPCPYCSQGCVSARSIEPLEGIAQQANALESHRLNSKGEVASLLQHTLEALPSDRTTPSGSPRPSSSISRPRSYQQSITTVFSHSNGFFKDTKALKFAFSNRILWKRTYQCFATLAMYGASDMYWELPTEFVQHL